MNGVVIGSDNGLSPVRRKAVDVPEPIMTYCQLDPQKEFQCNINQNKIIFIQEMLLKTSSPNVGHFVPISVNVLQIQDAYNFQKKCNNALKYVVCNMANILCRSQCVNP